MLFYFCMYHLFVHSLWICGVHKSVRVKQTQSMFAEQVSESDKSHSWSRLFCVQVTETLKLFLQNNNYYY